MTAFDVPQPKDKVALLKRIPVFASCTEKQLLLIASRTRLVEYKKGEAVYREGDVANAFYIVVSGRLRVFSGMGVQEKTFTVLHDGDAFGEISLLTGETHSATVQALNDTLVLQLEKADFEDLINRIPSLVLYLSRLLSRRLRMKELLGEYAEATIVAIYSATRGVGRTLFAIALGAALKQDTHRETIIVDLTLDGTNQDQLYGAARHSQMPMPATGLLSEAQLSQALYDHPLGFSVLAVGQLLSQQPSDQAIAPLFSMLTKRYSYILIDLPVEVDVQVLKSLTQSDLIFLMTDQDPENLLKTKSLAHKVQDVIGSAEQRIKVIVNFMSGSQRLEKDTVTNELGVPVAHVLPRVFEDGRFTLTEFTTLLASRDSAYAVTVRRIARELNRSLIGLALGSGAALGLAHIGVLKVIEREKIPVDIVAGSSIGSLIAGLWAAGKSAEELERMALRFRNPWDIQKLFVLDFGIPLISLLLGAIIGVVAASLTGSWPMFFLGFVCCVGIGLLFGALAGGPIQGAQLMKRLQKDFEGKTFDDTWLPLKVVAANPVAREEVIFDSGPLEEAVRASVSIPGIFKPVLHNGKICLDGGVVNPVPVSVLKRAGAHRVIAVNVFPTTMELVTQRQTVQQRRIEREAQLATRSFPVRLLTWLRQELMRSMSPLVFDVIMRSMQSMEYQIAEVACHEADLTLRPTVPDAHWLEFFAPEKFIRRGEEVAMEHVAELKRLAGVSEQSVDNP
jgi:NTE family protein